MRKIKICKIKKAKLLRKVKNKLSRKISLKANQNKNRHLTLKNHKKKRVNLNHKQKYNLNNSIVCKLIVSATKKVLLLTKFCSFGQLRLSTSKMKPINKKAIQDN